MCRGGKCRINYLLLVRAVHSMGVFCTKRRYCSWNITISSDSFDLTQHRFDMSNEDSAFEIKIQIWTVNLSSSPIDLVVLPVKKHWKWPKITKALESLRNCNPETNKDGWKRLQHLRYASFKSFEHRKTKFLIETTMEDHFRNNKCWHLEIRNIVFVCFLFGR